MKQASNTIHPLVEVAVGIIHQRASDGTQDAHNTNVLFAQRPAGKPYAGWWEFPGGKIEGAETTELALARELREELGIQILDCHHWLTQRFAYPHAHVSLRMCHVRSYSGNAQSLEGQHLRWGSVTAPPFPFLPAALTVLKAMQLPCVLRLTAAHAMGFESWHHRLCALDAGLVIVHEPDSALPNVQAVFDACLAWKKNAPLKRTVLVSSRHPQAWWGLCDGVHLTELDLTTLSQRPSCLWVGASVHSATSLEIAAQKRCNYVMAGTVLASQSHPRGQSIGWGALGDLLADCQVASYALGGLTQTHLPLAFAAGASGIALKRGAW